MNNDRELLELAAKAAGIKGAFFDYRDKFGLVLENGKTWNPLTDVGDALRLAVKLGTDIVKLTKSVAVKIDPMSEYIYQDYGDDPYAATRRAIVRAAAEIGKDMK